MEKLLDKDELSKRLHTVDTIIMQLLARRLDLAEQVGKYKRKHNERIFRPDIEDKRITEMRDWAHAHNINPHFVESVYYPIINESCKLQMIHFQEEILDSAEQLDDDQWYEKLKQNLLILTERWSGDYSTRYEHEYFATKIYREYELARLQTEIDGLPVRRLLVDLGCADGSVSLRLHETFDRVVGFDLCPHMQERASQLAESHGLQSKISFDCVDLENGIPLPDNSTSYVVMNLGTASDLRDIRKVVEETLRILVPGGGFFFSFYNRDALIYRWDILPWQTGLAAVVNIHRDSLDVHSKNELDKDEVIPVYARAYTVDEIRILFEEYGIAVRLDTYPTISATLPQELLAGQAGTLGLVESIDKKLTETDTGAYIIACAKKDL